MTIDAHVTYSCFHYVYRSPIDLRESYMSPLKFSAPMPGSSRVCDGSDVQVITSVKNLFGALVMKMKKRVPLGVRSLYNLLTLNSGRSAQAGLSETLRANCRGSIK